MFFEFAGERKRSGGKKEGKRVDEVVRWGFEAAELERGEYKVYASVLVCVCALWRDYKLNMLTGRGG